MEKFVKSFDEFVGAENPADKSAEYKAAEEIANKVPDKLKGAEGNAENAAEGSDINFWDYVKNEFETLNDKIWDLSKKTVDKGWKAALTTIVSDFAKIEQKINIYSEKYGTVAMTEKQDDSVKENFMSGDDASKFYDSYEFESVFNRINRLEVIDSKKGGRAYVNNDVKELKLSFQDKDKTLKLFVK